jgi:hypothetical protein
LSGTYPNAIVQIFCDDGRHDQEQSLRCEHHATRRRVGHSVWECDQRSA